MARLLLMGERCDRAHREIGELHAENAELRLRLEELSVAQDEARAFKEGGGVRAPSLVGSSLSSIREHSAGEPAQRGPLGGF